MQSRFWYNVIHVQLQSSRTKIGQATANKGMTPGEACIESWIESTMNKITIMEDDLFVKAYIMYSIFIFKLTLTNVTN